MNQDKYLYPSRHVQPEEVDVYRMSFEKLLLCKYPEAYVEVHLTYLLKHSR